MIELEGVASALVVSRDVRVRRLDDRWLVHFRADAPANLAFGLSDDAFMTFASFGSGSSVDGVEPERMLRLLPLVQAGMLIGTDLRLDGTRLELTLDEILALREAIPIDGTGMLELETLLLYVLARQNRLPGPVVELGSYMGGSTIALARGTHQTSQPRRVIAVDDHEWHRHVAGQIAPEAVARLPSTLPVLEQNLERAGVRDHVRILVKDTAAAAEIVTEDVSLLLVDAGHDARSLAADMDAWLPKVIAGGVVAFHDYHNSAWPDVQRLVDEARSQFAQFVSYQTLAIARMP